MPSSCRVYISSVCTALRGRALQRSSVSRVDEDVVIRKLVIETREQVRAQRWDTPELNVGLCADVHYIHDRRFITREPDKSTELSFIFFLDFLTDLACGQLIKTNHNRLSDEL